MKKALLHVCIVVMFCLATRAFAQGVAISTDPDALPDPSAMLDVKATGKGFLAPRMTFSQRPVSPVNGLLIYQTDSNQGFYYYTGIGWVQIGTSVSDYWQANGANIFYNSGKVAIGLNDPFNHGLNVINDHSERAAIRGAHQQGGNMYTYGLLGLRDATAYGIPVHVDYIGVLGVKTSYATEPAAGVFGWNDAPGSINYGGAFAATGNGTTNYGAYFLATNAISNNFAAAMKGRVYIESNGATSDQNLTLLHTEVVHNNYSDTKAIHARSLPQPGWGIGLTAEGGYIGINAVGAASSYNGAAFGIFSEVQGNAGERYAVYAQANTLSGTSKAVGVYSWAAGANENQAGYFAANGGTGGNVGIFAQATNSGTENLAASMKGRVKVESNSAGVDVNSNLLNVEVIHTNLHDTRAINSRSVPQPGYGFGIYAEGGYMGVRGMASATTYPGIAYGVYGEATGSAGTRYGVYGTASVSSGTANAVGVFGSASGATNNWAGYFGNGSVYVATDLRVGTTTQASGYKVSVNGKIACTEVLVQNMSNWPDFVFDEDYLLMNLIEVENMIRTNKHLPGIPSAQEVSENGLEIGEFQKRLLQKMEELTLYSIEHEKQIVTLQEQINILKHENEQLRQVDQLKSNNDNLGLKTK